jgi:hypothetical protein
MRKMKNGKAKKIHSGDCFSVKGLYARRLQHEEVHGENRRAGINIY